MLSWWMKTGKYLDSQICLYYWMCFLCGSLGKEVGGRRDREKEKILPKKKKKRGSKSKFEWFLCTGRKLGERQTTVWTFQGEDTLVTSSSGLMRLVRSPGRSSWSQSRDSGRLLPAENRTPPEQTHVSLPSVHSPLLHHLEVKVSRSTSWTFLGQLLRQCSTTPLSLRRKSTRYSSTKTSKGSCQSLFERRSQCILSNMTPEARQLLTSQCMT